MLHEITPALTSTQPQMPTLTALSNDCQSVSLDVDSAITGSHIQVISMGFSSGRRAMRTMLAMHANPPRAKANERPIFLFLFIFKVQTTGSGRPRTIASVTILIAPVIM